MVESKHRTRRWGGGSRSLATALLTAAAFIGSAQPAMGGTRVYTGDSVPVGGGEAHVVVAVRNGKPGAVGIALSGTALDGLPEATEDQETWAYTLPMPEGAPPTGYDHVVIDWNPQGHPPEGVYSVPHFDFHFYLVSEAEQQGATFKGDREAKARATPPTTLVPEGYAIPPDTAVEGMGLHGVDTAAPEFHGKPFKSTFIYGYYGGRLTFLEPMAALSYLKTRPEKILPVTRPAAYSYSAYYPARYRIGYNPRSDEYMIVLLALRPYKGTVSGAGMTEEEE